MDKVLCYLTSCHCSLGSFDATAIPAEEISMTSAFMKQGSVMCARESREEHETENEPHVVMAAEHSSESVSTRTMLKFEAPAFQPVPTDAKMDAVANALYLVLASCGQMNGITIERGIRGESPTLISAELQAGRNATTRCYDIMHLAKQSLDAITARLTTVSLLSARVQREDCGYSLRSSIACLPEAKQDSMCWDMFNKGYCPRRSQCRWYHPQGSDIGRLKVSIKYVEESRDKSTDEQSETGSSAGRYKLSLGELV
jgi:hypothetical protein